MDATDLGTELISLHDRPRLVSTFGTRYPGLSADSGYAAARKLHEHRLAKGWKPTGRKIGFTNRTLWERYGVHEPIWGTVYDRTLILSEDNKAIVPLANLSQPRIEPEICFRIQSPPPVTKDPDALLGCIEWVAHSVEIVQCHHPDWKLALADGTADNGLHGRLILGTPVDVRRISGLAAALPFLKVSLKKDGEIKDQGTGANVLGSPLLALAFLVELLARQQEHAPLEAGEIISTGTLTDAHPVRAGETWSTRIAGLGLPGLTLEFT